MEGKENNDESVLNSNERIVDQAKNYNNVEVVYDGIQRYGDITD